MDNYSQYIDVDVSIDKNKICINDIVNINIRVMNKSEFKLENGLFKLNLNKSIFELADNSYKSCINDYGAFGYINPNSFINISVPLKSILIPENLRYEFYFDMNFHFLKEDNELEDLNYRSKIYTAYFAPVEIFENDDFIYMVDKEEVFENDIVNHIIKLNNKTNVNVKNLKLNNISPSKLIFVENSLKINGIYQINNKLEENFNIGNIDSGESVKIEFQTKSLNIEEDINTRFSISYSTYSDEIEQKSKNIILKIKSPVIDQSDFIKNPDKYKLDIGDILEYKIEIVNKGNSKALNILLKDELFESLEYVENSLKINYINANQNLFEEGIKIKELKPFEKIIITYLVKAINICSNAKTYASLTYFGVEGGKLQNTKSNGSKITINGAKLGNNNVKKELSTSNVQIGDIISISLLLENTGNLDCESIKIYDEINTALEFIEGSLLINGIESENSNIYKGVSIERLKPNKKIVLSYQLKVIGIPKPNPILDRTIVNYSYLYNDKIKSNTVYSRKSKIYVYNPNLIIEDKKSFYKDKIKYKICKSDKQLDYDLTLINKGNVGLEDILLKVNLPKSFLLDIKSLKINNNYENDKILENRIELPDLNVFQETNIEFTCNYIGGEIEDLETLLCFEYQFKDFQYHETFKKIEYFKEKLFIISPKVEVNKKIYQIENFMRQEIIIKNLGNVKIDDVKLELNEPSFLKDITDKYTINNQLKEKEDILDIGLVDIGEIYNIIIDYPLKNILVNEAVIRESYITGKYNTFDNDSYKNIKCKSNRSDMKIIKSSLNIQGKSSSEVLILNEKYTYIFNITNEGNVSIDECKVNIYLDNNLEYIDNSLCINNKKINDKNLNQIINISNINPGEVAVIIFSFRVNNLNNRFIKIKCEAIANYKVEDNYLKQKFSSKEDVLRVENKSLEIIKCISHEIIQKGDILRVQNILNNTGTIEFENIVLIDNKNINLDFVKNSTSIDGENIKDINPIDGIYIKSLKAKENVFICYEYNYKPKKYSNKITHYSDINYCYKLGESKIKYENKRSEKKYIEVELEIFKQFNIENEYILDKSEPDIYEISSVFSEGKINDFHEINCIEYKNKENFNEDNFKIENNKKVMLKGNIVNRVEYLVNEKHSCLHFIERINPFTVVIDIPIDIYEENIDFRIRCEDVFFKVNNKRSFLLSSLILVEGII